MSRPDFPAFWEHWGELLRSGLLADVQRWVFQENLFLEGRQADGLTHLVFQLFDPHISHEDVRRVYERSVRREPVLQACVLVGAPDYTLCTLRADRLDLPASGGDASTPETENLHCQTVPAYEVYREAKTAADWQDARSRPARSQAPLGGIVRMRIGEP